MIFALEVATQVSNVYEAAILQLAYRVTPLVAGYISCALAVGWTVAAFAIAGQPARRHSALIVSSGGVASRLIVMFCVVVPPADVARYM